VFFLNKKCLEAGPFSWGGQGRSPTIFFKWPYHGVYYTLQPEKLEFQSVPCQLDLIQTVWWMNHATDYFQCTCARLYPLWVKKYDLQRAFVLIHGCRATCRKSVIIPAKGRDTYRFSSLSQLNHCRLPKLTLMYHVDFMCRFCSKPLELLARYYPRHERVRVPTIVGFPTFFSNLG
jgi:hypothetical protein